MCSATSFEVAVDDGDEGAQRATRWTGSRAWFKEARDQSKRRGVRSRSSAGIGQFRTIVTCTRLSNEC